MFDTWPCFLYCHCQYKSKRLFFLFSSYMRPRYFLQKRIHSHDRLCAIADGVYAVVITLLVLDLQVPEIPGATDPQLRADLLQQIPNFAAYAIAFILVGFFWVNHHRIFVSFPVCGKWTLHLNILHLFFISLMPYSTSLIGHYEGDQVATIIFSVNLGLASFSLSVLALYVLPKEEKEMDPSDGTWVKLPWWDAFSGTGIAIMSITVSFWSIPAALLLWPLVMLKHAILMVHSPPSKY